MNYSQIKKQLKELGVTKAVAEPITVNGDQAALLRWNGEEVYFFGIDYSGDPYQIEISEHVIEYFKDSNLS